MKRHIIAALIIGLIVGGLVVGLDIAHLLARPEQAVAQIFPETTSRRKETAASFFTIIPEIFLVMMFPPE